MHLESSSCLAWQDIFQLRTILTRAINVNNLLPPKYLARLGAVIIRTCKHLEALGDHQTSPSFVRFHTVKNLLLVSPRSKVATKKFKFHFAKYKENNTSQGKK